MRNPHTPLLESSPRSPQLEKSLHSKEDPAQPKIKKKTSDLFWNSDALHNEKSIKSSMQPLFLSCISNLQDADSNTTSGLGPDNRNSGDEMVLGFPGGSAGKESACDAGDLGSIPGLGKSPAEGKGHLLQYSGLEKYTDCMIHGVAKSWTWLRDFHFQILKSINLFGTT